MLYSSCTCRTPSCSCHSPLRSNAKVFRDPVFSSLVFRCQSITNKGFTLIELLITLVVISILSVIAYPSYSQYSTRGRLADGIAELSNLRLRIEQNYQDDRTYLKAGTADECVIDAPANLYFTFVCSNATATTYTWTASSKSGIGLGAADAYQYSIDDNGNQKTITFDGQAVAKNCWMSSKYSC